MMDMLIEAKYFVDIDRYRKRAHEIDWEAIGVILSCADIRRVVIVGWFTIDVPDALNRFQKGLQCPNFRYNGGESVSIEEFIETLRLPENQ